MRIGVKGLLARWALRQLALGSGILGVAALAFCWGRSGAQSPPPSPPAGAHPVEELPLGPPSSSDYARRVVAYIHNNIPITREDLGEYLIARQGTEKVELLVNRRIIEHACRARGIEVSDAEVEAALADDLKGLNVNRMDFVTKVLKQYGKTLYEWKEDVIRPKLALTKVCRDRVQVTDDEIRVAYEQHYGEKVACRMILIFKNEGRKATDIWEKVCKSPDEFDRAARTQAVAALAAKGGVIPPISRHFGDESIERQAFSLRPGEVSPLIDTPDGYVVLRCESRIEPDTTKKLEAERPALAKEVLDRKINQEIPKVFNEMKAQAAPKIYLKKALTQEDLERSVRQELQAGPAKVGPPAPPQGN
jgi:parvulin-like peptidyl-prolyl isomerase